MLNRQSKKDKSKGRAANNTSLAEADFSTTELSSQQAQINLLSAGDMAMPLLAPEIARGEEKLPAVQKDDSSAGTDMNEQLNAFNIESGIDPNGGYQSGPPDRDETMSIMSDASSLDLLGNNPVFQEQSQARLFDSTMAAAKAVSDPLSEPPFHQRFPRFIVRESWIERCLLLSYLKLEKPTVLPLEQQKTVKNIRRVWDFIEGVKWVTEKMWPLTLLILQAHDLHSLIHDPRDRYGNTFKQLFLGLSTNQASWSVNLGADLIGQPGNNRYWLGAGFMLSAPVLAGFINLIKQNLSADFAIADIHRDLHPNHTNYLTDTFRWLIPTNRLHRALSQAELKILWAPIKNTMREELLTDIIRVAQNHSSVTQRAAMAALANIANSFDPADRNKSQDPDYSDNFRDEKFIQGLVKIRNSALEALERLAGSRSSVNQLYANYLLWTLNRLPESSHRSADRLKQALFWLVTSYQFYAYFRYFELLYQKMQGAYEYAQAKNHCEIKEEKIWRYRPELGNYDCSVCGDWEFVYFKNSYTSQGCLEGLLAKPQTVSFILNKLTRLARHPGVTQLDLTQQAWPGWTEEVWSNFLNSIQKIVSPELTTFNLSRAVINPIFPEDNKIQQLADFLQTITVRQVDLSNQNIGPSNANRLFSRLNQTVVDYLALSNANLEDAAINTLSQNLQFIKTLILQNNGMSDFGVALLANGLVNSNITRLDVSGNLLSAIGFLNLSQQLPYTQLRQLSLSNIDLSSIDFYVFGQGLIRSPVNSLVMVNCNLGDTEMQLLSPYISVSKLTALDVSYNAIGDFSMPLLIEAAQNSSLTTINFAYNQIGDNGFMAAIPFLPNTTINNLILSNNGFSSLALTDLMAIIPDTTLTSLGLAGNSLGNAGAQIIAQGFASETCPLIEVDFSHNGIDDQGGSLLINALPLAKQLRTLLLADNNLTGVFVRQLTGLFQQNTTYLQTLILKGNQLDKHCVAALAEILPKTSLKVLDVSNNPALDDVDGLAVTENLIQFIPYKDRLRDQTLNLDQTRALQKDNAASQLKSINFANCNVTEQTARAACRILAPANMSLGDIVLTGNPINAQAVDIQSCHISAAGRHQPWFIFRFARQIKEYLLPRENVQWLSAQEIKQVDQEMQLLSKPRQIHPTHPVNGLPLQLNTSINRERKAIRTTHTAPSANLLLTALSGLLLLYLMYRLLAPKTRITNNRNTKFELFNSNRPLNKPINSVINNRANHQQNSLPQLH